MTEAPETSIAEDTAQVEEATAPFAEAPAPFVNPTVFSAAEAKAAPSRPAESLRAWLETPVAFAQPQALASRDEAMVPTSDEIVLEQSAIRADDGSLPPVDIDNHFFDRSELVLEVEERDARALLKATPLVARRRAELARYVKLATAASCLLCLAALVKVAVAHTHNATAGARQQTTAASAPPLRTVAALETPVVADPLPTTPPRDTAAAAPAEAKDAPAAVPADSAAPELDPKEAAKAKNASRSSLERGKVADAIEAGERSVALDPTDSEAWLILGAAYQEKGDMKNARRSYKACLDQGKRGPKYECAQMPH